MALIKSPPKVSLQKSLRDSKKRTNPRGEDAEKVFGEFAMKQLHVPTKDQKKKKVCKIDGHNSKKFFIAS